MANTSLSVRLSARLAAILDRATEHLDCSPSQLVEMLLRGSETYKDELLKIPVQGPFPEKRNLRLRPEAIQQLRRLTIYREDPSGGPVYDIERSTYVRSVLAYFFSTPQAFQSVLPNAPRVEEWTRVFEEEEQIHGATRAPRIARPSDPRIGIILILLAILALLFLGIVDLFKGSTQPPPEPRPPDPLGDSEEGLGEDTDHQSNPPSREET